MPKIKDQKLLYHLTRLENLGSILKNGLLPRAQLKNFIDVADQEIISDRKVFGLENFVPFHWFTKNPFDGRVQADHPQAKFVLITVRRSFAASNNWAVIPRHPLANGVPPKILTYQEGFQEIDWETMDLRVYRDANCKSVCMAECLSPTPVFAVNFFVCMLQMMR